MVLAGLRANLGSSAAAIGGPLAAVNAILHQAHRLGQSRRLRGRLDESLIGMRGDEVVG